MSTSSGENRLINQLCYISGTTTGMLDVVIITAKDSEFDAVKLVLLESGCKDLSPYQLQNKSGDTAAGGVTTCFNIKVDETSSCSIGVFKLLEMGYDGVVDFLPSLQYGIESKQVSSSGFSAMVGVCAGNPDKVVVGDLIAPCKISKLSGKEDSTDDSLSLETKDIEVNIDIQRAVNAALPQCCGYGWFEKYVPTKLKNTPTPRLLQDSILDILRTGDDGMTVRQLHESIISKHEQWPKKVITLPVIEDAVTILTKQGYIGKNDQKLIATASGKKHIEEIEASSPFPRSDQEYPKVHSNPTKSGDLVRVGMTREHWSKEADRVGQRKLGGLDMEGYGFLRYDRTRQPLTRRCFVKTVADYATTESKMDYYQEYGACLAAAFLLHVIEVNPRLASRK